MLSCVTVLDFPAHLAGWTWGYWDFAGRLEIPFHIFSREEIEPPYSDRDRDKVQRNGKRLDREESPPRYASAGHEEKHHHRERSAEGKQAAEDEHRDARPTPRSQQSDPGGWAPRCQTQKQRAEDAMRETPDFSLIPEVWDRKQHDARENNAQTDDQSAEGFYSCGTVQFEVRLKIPAHIAEAYRRREHAAL